MSNHTPGPWEFVNGRILSTVTKDEINHLVSDAVYEANERLKARAPELLEENERLRFLLRSIVDDLPTKRDWLNPDIEREAKAILKGS